MLDLLDSISACAAEFSKVVSAKSYCIHQLICPCRLSILCVDQRALSAKKVKGLLAERRGLEVYGSKPDRERDTLTSR